MTEDKQQTELEALLELAALALRKEILRQSERGVSIIYGDADGLAAAALEAAGVAGLLLRIESLREAHRSIRTAIGWNTDGSNDLIRQIKEITESAVSQ